MGSLDLRIIKTQRKLRQTFADMMREITFDEVSVYELCKRAGVRRATFYKHFKDKQDFLAFIVSSVCDEIKEKTCDIKASSPIDYYSEFAARVIEYFERQDDIIRRILNSAAFPTVYDTILRKTLSSIKTDLAANAESGVLLPTDIDPLALFINGGISQLVISYLIGEIRDKEYLIGSIRALLDKIF